MGKLKIIKPEDIDMNGIVTGIRGHLAGSLMSFIAAGRELAKVKDGKLWRVWGDHVHSFEEWVQKEVVIEKSTAYNAINVYEHYAKVIEQRPELAQISQTRLVQLLPLWKHANEDEKEELVREALELPTKDWKIRIKERKEKSPKPLCLHDGEFTYWRRCVVCGDWLFDEEGVGF